GGFVGRGLEKIGMAVHSNIIQKLGQGIQNICAETAKKTGNTREYDSETASFEETQSMAEILSDFHSTLKPQIDDIEFECKGAIDSYFDVLIQSLSEAIKNDRVTKKLKSRQYLITNAIGNAFGMVLSQRVSLGDYECKKILEMSRGESKEKAMGIFGKKVIREGKEQLCKNVRDSITELNEEISEEIDGVLERQTLGMREIERQLEELIAHRTSSIENTEAIVLKCVEKLSVAELTLNILEVS
ncbi:MAG: hypothetical protein RSD33_10265, partial [Clostridium sp.]